MITSLSQFKKSLNENFGEEAQVQEPVQGAQEVQVQDDIQVQEEEGFSLETLTAAVNAELENMNAELEEGQEATPALTEEQLMAVFNAVSPMVAGEEAPIQDEEAPIQDEEEIVEEGLFFKPTQEMIDKANERIAQIKQIAGDRELMFMIQGDNTQVPFTDEAVHKALAKYKYKATMNTVDKGNKVVTILKPAATLLQKIAAGSKGSVSINR